MSANTAVRVTNLTPHDLVVVHDDGSKTTFPKSGTVARVSSRSVQVDDVNGVPLFDVVFGDVTDLPEFSVDTLLVVSALVRNALPSRKDLVSPGDLVRDDAGNVVGCKGFIVNP